MFYDRFIQLCQEHNIAPTRAAIDAGLSKSTVTKWKNSPESQPSGAVITKLSEYFGITKSELLGEPEKEPKEKTVTCKSNGLEEIQDTYLRLARGAQELGLDDADVDAILALYRAHKEKNR